MMKRILFCITVYNGRDFVPRTLESASRLKGDGATVDVLILDDCSPEPGWSDQLEALCHELGLGYYRSPRNLGIPRNVNLGLNTAMAAGYDYVVISNSDVIYPSNLIDGFLAVVDQPEVGSVTAWSNNVSVYSLPNTDPDVHLANQATVDWVSAAIAGNFGGALMDIPAGISFCIMIRADVLREVGLMDPVFGRGYCEETDWTLRSKKLGYRICLAPGIFVYHSGGGSNREAGLLSEGQSTVPEHEAIIDLRYPQFRDQVAAFMSSGILDDAQRDAIDRIVADAGREFGYCIEVGWLPRHTGESSVVRCVVAPDSTSSIALNFAGFTFDLGLADGQDAGEVLREFFGTEPTAVNLYDRGGVSRSLVAEFGLAADFYQYPTQV